MVKRFIIIVAIAMASALGASAQVPDQEYFVLDERPTFKGGSPNEFAVWITKHVKYPKEAKENGVEGTVKVRFVIDKDGRVSEAYIEQGVHPLLDAEAIRVVMKSPKWKPGIADGQPVRVSYTAPIIFGFR